MNDYAKYQLRLAKERRTDEFRQAADARRFARPSRPIRQRVGQSIVRMGERLAGERSLELARFR
jgi:Skp family chaperone for outer membrane proteins